MRIWMVTGGARSGKSRHALELAKEAGGDRVTFVATARVSRPGSGESPGRQSASPDAEMARRIRAHRAERPDDWETLEPPVPAAEAVARARHAVVILDCLTLLVADAVHSAGAEEEAFRAAERAVTALLDAAADRGGRLIVVTNEVGLGLVPPNATARWFRDALGGANRRVAEAAERVTLLVSGLPVRLKEADRSTG